MNDVLKGCEKALLKAQLQWLVGKRYFNFNELKQDIETLTHHKVVNVVLSESERYANMDFMIDFELENDCEVYTIFYLIDNAKKYCITEVL